jgi:hypothetical protein
MFRNYRFVVFMLGACVLAACASKSQNSADAPLAFVPADTAYVYANLEPLPGAVVEQWSQRMHDYWPAIFGMYENMLQRVGKDGGVQAQRIVKIASVVIGEIKQHDSWDKLRQIGLKPDARIAFYGVGIVPVMRLELGDAAAFKAEVARIESMVGERIPLAKIGDQEYWQLGNDKIAAVVAIEGSHLVFTAVPPTAGDALKQTLLGVTRPAQDLAAAGTLQTLAKQYGYSPYGEGFVDVVRLMERFGAGPSGTDAEFAKALDLPVTPVSAACRAEFLDMAHKFPRLVAGAEELSPQRMRLGAQVEIEATLAEQIAATLGAAPGTGQAGTGIVDVSISLPILRLKDFWIRQAEAVAAKPFTCSGLAPLNDVYRESKQNIDVTVPPPASDLTGLRITLDTVDLASISSATPDVSGKILMALNNPMAALAMAQLALPGLANFKISPDGKSVPLPAGLAPAGTPPLFAAMSDKALAIGAGVGEDATLSGYLNAAPASEPVFLRLHFSGKVYALMAQSFEKMKAMLPADQQAHFDEQARLLAMYEKWLRSGEITFTATKTGVAVHETVEMN